MNSEGVNESMIMPIQPVTVPLFDDWTRRVAHYGDTQVLLERIVHAFEDGATPEGNCPEL